MNVLITRLFRVNDMIKIVQWKALILYLGLVLRYEYCAYTDELYWHATAGSYNSSTEGFY